MQGHYQWSRIQAKQQTNGHCCWWVENCSLFFSFENLFEIMTGITKGTLHSWYVNLSPFEFTLVQWNMCQYTKAVTVVNIVITKSSFIIISYPSETGSSVWQILYSCRSSSVQVGPSLHPECSIGWLGLSHVHSLEPPSPQLWRLLAFDSDQFKTTHSLLDMSVPYWSFSVGSWKALFV